MKVLSSCFKIKIWCFLSVSPIFHALSSFFLSSFFSPEAPNPLSPSVNFLLWWKHMRIHPKKIIISTSSIQSGNECLFWKEFITSVDIIIIIVIIIIFCDKDWSKNERKSWFPFFQPLLHLFISWHHIALLSSWLPPSTSSYWSLLSSTGIFFSWHTLHTPLPSPPWPLWTWNGEGFLL